MERSYLSHVASLRKCTREQQDSHIENVLVEERMSKFASQILIPVRNYSGFTAHMDTGSSTAYLN